MITFELRVIRDDFASCFGFRRSSKGSKAHRLRVLRIT